MGGAGEHEATDGEWIAHGRSFARTFLRYKGATASLDPCQRESRRVRLTVLGAEVREHREDAAMVVLRPRDLQLHEDALDVLLDSALGDEQALRDRAVAAAFSHEGEDFSLSVTQVVDRIVAGAATADELRDDGRIEDGASVADPLDGVGELGQVGDSVLQQVADPAGVISQQLERVARADVLGQHEHAELRVACAQLPRRPQALVRVGRRHADVHDRDIGALLLHLAKQLVRVARLANDFEPRLGEQTRHSLAQEHGVVGDHDTQGISALSRVPAPGGLSRTSVPPSASTRSESPRSPDPPAGSAPPDPSSATSTTARPLRRYTVTETACADAYFATFASASATT